MAPALTVAAAFGGDGFNAPSLLGVFDSAPYFHNGAVPTLEAGCSASAPTPAFLAAVRAHWRAGTGGDSNILDTDASAVTDLIAFVRTIDEQHARRSRPPISLRTIRSSPTPRRSATAQKDPPLGTPALDCRP